MSLLGVDIGTSGCKAVAFSESGRMLFGSHQNYQLSFPMPNHCELDPSVVWASVMRVIHCVSNEVKAYDPIQAIGFSSLADSVTPVDSSGNHLANTIVGSTDRRAINEAERIKEIVGSETVFKLTGLPVHSMYAVPKIMWLKKHKPDLYSKAYKFVGWTELVQMKLGLSPIMDFSMGSRTLGMNIKTKSWDSKLIDCLGIDKEKFNPLDHSYRVVGEIDKKYAEPLALERGVVIVPGGFDQSCAALGVGVHSVDRAALSIGTCAVITAVTDTCNLSNQLLIGNHGCNAHVFEDKYISIAVLVSGGSVLRWYRDTIGELEAMRAQKLGKDPYEYIISLANDAPSKLFVVPYFAGCGTPKLNPNKKGIFFGLTLDTDRSQIVKALLEGICYELRLNIESLRQAGLDINHLRAVGGGSRSDRWMQLHADILGIPIEVTDVNEAGCRGAAFLAGYGKGIYTSQDDIIDMVKVKKIYEPRSNVSQIYDETYNNYKSLLHCLENVNL